MTFLIRNVPDTAVEILVLGAETVVERLEEAGRTLLALPSTGPSTRLVQSGMEWIRDAAETYPPHKTRIKPAVPDAATITRMDEALGWVPLIPIDRYVLRRIVGARSLVNPMTDRHVFSWRRLGLALGADHKAIKQWHAKGIAMIVAALQDPALRTAQRPGLPQPPRHHRSPDA